MSFAPSTVDGLPSGVRIVRPSVRGIFPQLLPGVIRNFYGIVALGNGTQKHIGAFRTLDGVFLGVCGHGAAMFATPLAAASVAGEALGIEYAGDAANMADLINDQLGAKCPRLGRYMKELCDGESGGEDDYG